MSHKTVFQILPLYGLENRVDTATDHGGVWGCTDEALGFTDLIFHKEKCI